MEYVILFSVLFLIFGVPVIAIATILISLIRFLRTPGENTAARKKHRLGMLIGSIIAGVYLAGFLTLVILFSTGTLTFM